MRVSVYEVGPRDGLQSLSHTVSTDDKKELIEALYSAGLSEVEEVSFAHPKLLPQMADAEAVYSGRGAGLVMNKRGFDRAVATGVDKINIVFSPCEHFNLNNMGKTRSEIVLMYKTFMDKFPKERVRVYISMAFGSKESGRVTPSMMKSCVADAKMFGDTIVLSDTTGVGFDDDIKRWAAFALHENLTPALHLHHKGDESRAVSLVRAGLLAGIKQFDSSIGGLGGCPFAKGSGANLATETLVKYLIAWGFETGVDLKLLQVASDIANRIKHNEVLLKSPTVLC
tara:strand:+ start:855 stop:1706 length:852 start_codon:yes stop_codon:yes gene_type:complete